jgi:hypothetical protein
VTTILDVGDLDEGLGLGSSRLYYSVRNARLGLAELFCTFVSTCRRAGKIRRWASPLCVIHMGWIIGFEALEGEGNRVFVYYTDWLINWGVRTLLHVVVISNMSLHFYPSDPRGTGDIHARSAVFSQLTATAWVHIVPGGIDNATESLGTASDSLSCIWL